MPGWPPRWLSPYDPAAPTDGPAVAEFVETFCRIDKDSVGGKRGELIRLRPFQHQLFGALLTRRPDGRRRHRQALVGMARKNGKSGLGSGLALAGLYTGPAGAEVYSCAGDRDQARIVFGTAKQMVQMDEELSSLAKLYRDAIEIPSTGSVYRALSSVAELKEGLNPTLVVFDEVHVQPNDELWNVMALAMGARVDPLLVGITTAGVMVDRQGRDTLCYRLYQHGVQVARGEAADPSFLFAWWEPRDGMAADHTDPRVWAEANPGYGDLVDPADFAENLPPKMRESEFRTKRTNVFVASEESWFPLGVFEAAGNGVGAPPAGTRVVLGFDGSFSRDSTALVGATVDGDPHLWLVRAWERPVGGPEGWRVPRGEVMETIRQACRTYDVLELAHDPARWQDEMQEMAAEGIPAVEFPQSAARMGPACEDFHAAVVEGRRTHDGSEVLVRHVRNAVTHTDRFGTRIQKEHKDSPRVIDAAPAAVMADDRAEWHRSQPQPELMFAIT